MGGAVASDEVAREVPQKESCFPCGANKSAGPARTSKAGKARIKIDAQLVGLDTKGLPAA